jgi:serine phosphatase RsbU (regulator of sigma subunit)
MDQDQIEQAKKKIDEVNYRAWRFRGVSLTDYDPMKEGLEVYELAKEIGYTLGIARSLLSLGMGSFIIKHDAALSISQLNEALGLFKEMGDKKWTANALLSLGIIHNTIGNREAALYNALRGFDFYENNEGDDNDRIMAHYILGTIYKDLKKFEEAEHCYIKGVSIPGLDDNTWGGRIYAGLSGIYTDQEKYDEAIKVSMKGLEILKAEKNKFGESRALTEIGIIYKRQKKYEKALPFFFEGLAIREENNAKQFVLGSLSEIADVYKATNETEKAIDYLKRAEAIAVEIGQAQKLGNILRDLGSIYKSIGQFEKALFYNEKFLAITLDLNRKETEIKINSLQGDLVKEKEKEIERLRNVELKNAYDLISEKNKEITDSIKYAKRIQRALLAHDDLLARNLADYFVFYKPKDIVSGDFYWASEKDNRFYLAVCDSTGHGVPGAFMSLLNTSFLNAAINEKGCSEPHHIFNHVRQRLIENLSQDGAKDGMDGILICIDKNLQKISYSAANNAPVVVRNGVLNVYRTDKMPVGKGESDVSFSPGEIEIQKGDMLYLFSDGYADQFGGDKGKKLKQKGLNELLLSISKAGLKIQLDSLENHFRDWKGNLEQIDDVLVIGIRF